MISEVSLKWDLHVASPNDLDSFLESLAEKISDMMQSDPRRFFQALYRLDVSEEKTQQILSGRLLDSGVKKSKSRALAELIFEREVAKAKSRGDL